MPSVDLSYSATTLDFQKACVQLLGVFLAVVACIFATLEVSDYVIAASERFGEEVVFGAISFIGFVCLRLDLVGTCGEFTVERVFTVLTYLHVVPWQQQIILGFCNVCLDLARATLVFATANIFAEAIIPDDGEYRVPKSLQFITHGVAREFTGRQVEVIFLNVTSRILNAYMCLSVYNFILKVKNPPKDVTLNYEDGVLSRYLMGLQGQLKGEQAKYAGLAFLVDRMVNVVLVVAFSMQVLSIFGLTLKAITAVAGVGALAVSFAARPLVENLISGWIIFVSNPFTIGEHIVAGHVHGYVEKIGWLVTTLKTAHGVELVPNNKLANQTLVNESRLGLSVASTNTLMLCPVEPGRDDLKGALKAMKDVLKEHPLTSDHTAVWLQGMNESTGLMEFCLEYAIKNRPDDREEVLMMRSMVMADVYRTAQEYGYAGSKGKP